MTGDDLESRVGRLGVDAELLAELIDYRAGGDQLFDTLELLEQMAEQIAKLADLARITLYVAYDALGRARGDQ